MEIIPTVKIVNRDGIKAVKNGQKANKFSAIPAEKKPSWIRVKASFDPRYKLVKDQVSQKKLNTVCEEAMCPNISEHLRTNPNTSKRVQTRPKTSKHF